jgi:hypothetical protein
LLNKQMINNFRHQTSWKIIFLQWFPFYYYRLKWFYFCKWIWKIWGGWKESHRTALLENNLIWICLKMQNQCRFWKHEQWDKIPCI